MIWDGEKRNRPQLHPPPPLPQMDHPLIATADRDRANEETTAGTTDATTDAMIATAIRAVITAAVVVLAVAHRVVTSV